MISEPLQRRKESKPNPTPSEQQTRNFTTRTEWYAEFSSHNLVTSRALWLKTKVAAAKLRVYYQQKIAENVRRGLARRAKRQLSVKRAEIRRKVWWHVEKSARKTVFPVGAKFARRKRLSYRFRSRRRPRRIKRTLKERWRRCLLRRQLRVLQRRQRISARKLGGFWQRAKSTKEETRYTLHRRNNALRKAARYLRSYRTLSILPSTARASHLKSARKFFAKRMQYATERPRQIRIRRSISRTSHMLPSNLQQQPLTMYLENIARKRANVATPQSLVTAGSPLARLSVSAGLIRTVPHERKNRRFLRRRYLRSKRSRRGKNRTRGAKALAKTKKRRKPSRLAYQSRKQANRCRTSLNKRRHYRNKHRNDAKNLISKFQETIHDSKSGKIAPWLRGRRKLPSLRKRRRSERRFMLRQYRRDLKKRRPWRPWPRRQRRRRKPRRLSAKLRRGKSRRTLTKWKHHTTTERYYPHVRTNKAKTVTAGTRQAALLLLPYTVRTYRNKPKARTSGGFIAVTRGRRAADRARNNARWKALRQLYETRRDITKRWNQKFSPLARPVTLHGAEKFERDLYAIRNLPSVARLAVLTTVPKSIRGVVRRRRSLGQMRSTLPDARLNPPAALSASKRHLFPGRGRKRRTFEAFTRSRLQPKQQIAQGSHSPRPAYTDRACEKRFKFLAVDKLNETTHQYLTKQQRGVGARTEAEFHPKTRLLETPMRAAASHAFTQHRANQTQRLTLARGTAKALLRQALLVRNRTRQACELRTATAKRRLDVRQQDPFWVVSAKKWRARQAKGYVKYEIKADTNAWIFAGDSVRGYQHIKPRTPSLTTPWGKTMANSPRTVRFMRYRAYTSRGRSITKAKITRMRRRRRWIGSRSRPRKRKPIVLKTKKMRKRRRTGAARRLRDVIERLKLYVRTGIKSLPPRKKQVKSHKPPLKKPTRKRFKNRRLKGRGYYRDKRMPKRAKGRRYTRKTRKFYRQQRRLTRASVRRLFGRLANARKSFVGSLHTARSESWAEFMPIHFNQPMSQRPGTASEHILKRQGLQEVSRQRHRRVAESIGATATFIPQLLNLLLRRAKPEGASPEEAAKILPNLYWSLRMFLWRGPEEHRSNYSRQEIREKCKQVRREFNRAALRRYFTAREITAVRARFQPYKLVGCEVQQKVADEWLRKAIPLFHNLRHEDSEKYKRLAITPYQTTRVQPSAKAVTEWNTQNLNNTMEDQYRNATSSKYSPVSSRFENMLITTRRTPLFPGSGAIAAMKTTTPLHSRTTRTPFFSRAYMTNAPTAPVSSLYTFRTEVQNRRGLDKDSGLDDAGFASNHRHLKNSLVATHQSGRREVRRSTRLGRINGQLMRGKSVRSANYLERKVGTPESAPVVVPAPTQTKTIYVAALRRRPSDLRHADSVNSAAKAPLARAKPNHYVTRATITPRTVQIRRKTWRIWRQKRKMLRLIRNMSRSPARTIWQLRRRQARHERKIKRQEKRKRNKVLNKKALVNRVRVMRRAQRVISLRAASLELAASQHMFNSHRDFLWQMLTAKWRKKARFVRSWLREMKYALKKQYWNSQAKDYDREFERFQPARIRLRELIWQESDRRFFKPGLWKFFSFNAADRKRAGWLEPLIYKNSLYRTRRAEYRRDRTPGRYHSNRRFKLLQKFFKTAPGHTLLKQKIWRLLRKQNQQLHRSALKICTAKAASKHFRKRARKKPATTGMEHNAVGTLDRMDINLVLLGIAPSVYWGRRFATMGLLRVNGKLIENSSYRLQPNDFIEWEWARIEKMRSSFLAQRIGRDVREIFTDLFVQTPKNFVYNAKIRAAVYLRHPTLGDLPETGRINEYLFNTFRLDTGLGM